MKQLMLLIFFAGAVLTLSQNITWAVATVRKIIGLFAPVFLGLAIAFFLNIFMKIFEERLFVRLKKCKNKRLHSLIRPLSLLSAFMCIVLLLCIVGFVVLPEVGKLFVTLKNTLPGWISYVIGRIDMLLTEYGIDITAIDTLAIDWKSAIDKLFSSVVKGSETVLATAIAATGGVINFGTNLVLGIVISIYVLAQKEKICSFFHMLSKAVFPKKMCDEILRITRMASFIFSKYIIGQLTEAVVLGSLCFVGMLIFGFPQAVVISVFVSVMALVPIVGAFVAAAVGAVLIIMEAGLLKGILFIVFLTVLQQIEGNLIYPRVVGKTVGLPGILVLISIIVGGDLFGVLGILLAVPTSALMYTLIKEFIAKRAKWKK